MKKIDKPIVNRLKNKYLLFITCKLLLSALILSKCSPKEVIDTNEINFLQYVDPMIGTGFHGHTFPGPTWPHGQIQLSPDTHIMGWEASSGYHYDDTTLYGFSHNHLSGTGIGDLGDFLFLPYTHHQGLEKPVGTLDHRKETAEAGYYKVQVDPWGVTAELTANERSGWHRYTYPKDEEAHLMVDLSHILQPNWGHRLVESTVKIVDEYTIQGYRLTSGWAHKDPIWFYCQFDQPVLNYQVQEVNTGNAEGMGIIAHLNFGKLSTPLQARVAISAVDQEGAKNNLEQATIGQTFDTILKTTQEQWNQELSIIRIKTEDTDIMKNFYTGLYHTMIAPSLYSDVDGRYRGMDGKIHINAKSNRYTAYSLWDVYRAWLPLMTIIKPSKVTSWSYDLFEQSLEGGLLPKWPLNGNYTGTMVGYPAVSFLNDALQKQLIDTLKQEILIASQKCATWQPAFAKKHEGTRAARVMPSHILYKDSLGFVPIDKLKESVSYGLEMAYYDWCIAQMAKIIGKDSLYNVYTSKSTAYQNYFDKEVNFMRGKNIDGTWKSGFNPRFSDHLHGAFVEGNAWQWTTMVPHDVPGLAKLMGGPSGLGIWLDSLFSTSSQIDGENASRDITGFIGQYAHGNEPGHHVPYLYQHTDRPWKTQKVLDSILYNFYKPTPEGIIGNEDCGQMSAWYILNTLGIYQMTVGDPTFSIGRPLIDEASIKISDGFFKIKVLKNSKKNKYISRVLLDGKALENKQLSYFSIKEGSELTIEMTNNF